VKQRGFTLLEVLVALFIGGLVLTGLFSALRTVLRASSTLDHARERVSDLDGADRVLRDLVTRANPVAAMRGTTSTLAFVTELPTAPGLVGGLAEVALGVDAGHHFVARWKQYDPADGQSRFPHGETVLLDDVAGIVWAFWDSDGAAWVDRWDRPVGPDLIRLRLTFPRNDPRHWPDIVIAPRVSRVTGR
jgi:general secretion pathway protein J